MTVGRSFSSRWVLVSLVVFFALELALGGVVFELVVRKYLSAMFHYRLQVALSLGSYLLGGFVVGLISPGLRILEPAVGAFVAVALTLLFGVFMPWRFAGITADKLLLGGGIAFVVALVGARAGEKLAGNLRDRET